MLFLVSFLQPFLELIEQVGDLSRLEQFLIFKNSYST